MQTAAKKLARVGLIVTQSGGRAPLFDHLIGEQESRLSRKISIPSALAVLGSGNRHGPVSAADVTSSVITLKPASVQGPKEVTMATSVASRPRAIKIRPMRGLLAAGIGRVMPAVTEIDFEPGAEVHRLIVERHADVAEIAGAVTRRNVHAAA